MSKMIDGSDSDDDADFCGRPDHFDALFKQFKNNAVPRSPSPSPNPVASDGEAPDESPSSSKKSKENGESKTSEAADIHEQSTDSCNSNDPDVEGIFAEFHEFIDTCKGSPSKSKAKSRKSSGKAAVTGATSSGTLKKGVTTRAAAKPVPPPPVVEDSDDDIQILSAPATNSLNSHNNAVSPGTSSDYLDFLDDDILEVVPVEREEQTVRVRWKGQIHRFRVYETDTVSRLKTLLADKVGGVLSGDIHFYTNDNEIPLDSWRTIKEIDLEFTTIIEALRKAQYKPAVTGSAPATPAYEEELPPVDPNLISIRIQDGSLRKKVIVLYVRKTVPLSNLREMYLARSGLEGTKTVDQIRFMFDGEVVDLSETPNSLDFEEDECLDVIIKKELKVESCWTPGSTRLPEKCTVM